MTPPLTPLLPTYDVPPGFGIYWQQQNHGFAQQHNVHDFPDANTMQWLLESIEKQHEPKINVALFCDPRVYFDRLAQLEKIFVSKRVEDYTRVKCAATKPI